MSTPYVAPPLTVIAPNEPVSPSASSSADTASQVAAADATLRPAPTHVRPKRGWLQWVPSDRQQLADTEACLLHHLKHRYLQRFVAGINTVSSVVPTTAAANNTSGQVAVPPGVAHRHVVLIHGFGGGLAMFMPNFDFLVAAAAKQREVIQVHMIDMPGFARSDRHPMVKFANDREAMDYMCGHLREWFRAMGFDRPLRGTGANGPLPRVDLVGHSFGGYVTATFAGRYPDLVQRAVLCDPWGVPPKPEDDQRELPFKFRMALHAFYIGNPFSVLRAAGPWGPTLLPSVRKDFADRWEPIIGDPNIFFDYVFHCNASAHPTGEQAFQACCTGRIFAKRPLSSFVPKLPPRVGLGVIYGKRTWMDTDAGGAMVVEADRRRGPQSQNDLAFVDHAGHQVNTDNIEGFNQELARMLNFA
eukprot:CAMPEP_0174854424 /NCGR_PEP_ID=MMETSP1114-20130205/31120_1 /TAXON_ID=312471 /ORGANISM="Neobodo designis, Strain CCAP 1951/1" /LENGTH=415 /DNA_ID=CAMNT_0016089117 /DNA_START=32 /DNA_END=1279 /DNA_ORIENTATION=+